MTKDQLIDALQGNRDEYIQFDRVQNKRCQRPDLHAAFLLLNELVPGTGDMIACSEHDEFWLDVSVDDLAAVVTLEQAVELIRCGIRYDSGSDSLAMFS